MKIGFWNKHCSHEQESASENLIENLTFRYNTRKFIRRNSFHNNMDFDIKTRTSIAPNDTVNPWYSYRFSNTPSTAYYCLQPSSPLLATPSLSDTPLPSCVTTPTRTQCSFALFTYKQVFNKLCRYFRTNWIWLSNLQHKGNQGFIFKLFSGSNWI